MHAAEMLGQILSTAYGPRGMDKMIIPPPPQKPIITSDGFLILKDIDILHPGAKMIQDLAYRQAQEAGDGVITVVILAGELLKRASSLIEQKLHPITVITGYLLALERALEIVQKIAIPVGTQDTQTLIKVASTAAGTKSTGLDPKKLGECAYRAVSTVNEYTSGKPVLDKHRIMVFKKVGGSNNETRLVKGLVFDHALIHPQMPKKIKNAKIALLRRQRYNPPLEIKKKWDYLIPKEIIVNDPEYLRKFYDERKQLITGQVDKIVKAGANVVVTIAGCDFPQASLLARHGIQTIIRVADEGGIGRLEKATGGRSVVDPDDLTPEHLGYAAVTEEKQVGEDKIFIVDGCKDPKSVAILVQGTIQSIVDQAEIAVNHAIAASYDIQVDPRIVGGGCSVEAELAYQIRKFAPTVEGRQQLAVYAFAEALEGVVKALAKNSGLDPTISTLKLRTAHSEKRVWTGLSLENKDVQDMVKLDVIEPAFVKEHALKSAVEAACLVLRVDEIISGRPEPKEIPGQIPGYGKLSLGPKPLYPSAGPEDIPDETKKAIKKAKYIKSPTWRPPFP